MSRDVPRNPIVGGPVCTRTADHSLHVNPLPAGRRICNLDCLYCPFPHGRQMPFWPRAGDVGAAVMNALHECPEVDSITVSGPGEPTLHPRFGGVLGDVLSARRVRPELPVRVVTNAERVLQPLVRRLLGFADERVVRIDAGGDRIARSSRSPSLRMLREALQELSDFTVESVFVEGVRGNTGESDVAGWIDLLALLQPRHVYVTTIAEEPIDPGVEKAAPEALERIAARLRSRTRASITVLP